MSVDGHVKHSTPRTVQYQYSKYNGYCMVQCVYGGCHSQELNGERRIGVQSNNQKLRQDQKHGQILFCHLHFAPEISAEILSPFSRTKPNDNLDDDEKNVPELGTHLPNGVSYLGICSSFQLCRLSSSSSSLL